MANYKMHILVCGGTGCLSSGSGTLTDNLKNVLKEKGMEGEVQVLKTG